MTAQDECSFSPAVNYLIRVRKRGSACSILNSDLRSVDDDVSLEISSASRVISNNIDLYLVCLASKHDLLILSICSSRESHDMIFDEYNSILFNYEIDLLFNFLATIFVVSLPSRATYCENRVSMLINEFRTAIIAVLLSCLAPRGLYYCAAFDWTYRNMNDYSVCPHCLGCIVHSDMLEDGVN